MHPEPEDEYFLGAGDDDDNNLDDNLDDDRRTRRGALIGLAAVVVMVAVAITLTSLFVDTSAGHGPRAAARAWGTALVHGDTAARHRLECAGGPRGTDPRQLVLADATGVSTGAAYRLRADRWSVPLEINGPDGSVQDSVELTVVRVAGRYRIC